MIISRYVLKYKSLMIVSGIFQTALYLTSGCSEWTEQESFIHSHPHMGDWARVSLQNVKVLQTVDA